MIRNTLIIIFILTGTIFGFSQTVNGIAISKIDVEYIEIIGSNRIFSNKVNVKIDFGQKVKFLSGGKETLIKDKDGHKIIFNSMIDALNFMGSNNYEFVQAYIKQIEKKNEIHYILRRKQ